MSSMRATLVLAPSIVRDPCARVKATLRLIETLESSRSVVPFTWYAPASSTAVRARLSSWAAVGAGFAVRVGLGRAEEEERGRGAWGVAGALLVSGGDGTGVMRVWLGCGP